jgi:hypothetical protein
MQACLVGNCYVSNGGKREREITPAGECEILRVPALQLAKMTLMALFEQVVKLLN